MRLITLVLALAVISGLVVYNKNSLFPTKTDNQQTVKQQAKQIIDNAKNATNELSKQMEEEEKRLDQYSK